MTKATKGKLSQTELKEFLDEQVKVYNTTDFIAADPISIPHLFSKKEDIEISAFLTATISWGQRTTILKNAKWLFQQMDHAPHQFVLNASKKEIKQFDKFVHRTFNGTDCTFFIQSLKSIYGEHESMGHVFEELMTEHDMYYAIHHFRKLFFEMTHEKRTEKHFSDPLSNSACKRFNMFLRWMIRKDKSKVDFGLWNIPSSVLYCPLDVHSGRIARELGILERKQDDWKAVKELTENLLKLDANDPVKYDFALFGLGVNERFTSTKKKFV